MIYSRRSHRRSLH